MKSTKERGRRIHGDGSSGNSLPTSTHAKPRSFFKLMLSPTLQSTKLRIPEAFARAFSDELSGTAILTVPTGESWEVVLANEDNQLWFRKGWQEFVEYFSISLAYFLLFLYEGTLKFKVHIFTPTACEITYPHNACNGQQGEPLLALHSSQIAEQDSHNVNVATSVGASCRTNDSDMELETLDGKDEPSNNNVVSGEFGGRLSANEDMEQDLDAWSIHSSKTQRTPARSNVWLQSKGMMHALAAVGISLPTKPFFVTLVKKYNLDRSFVNIPVYFTRDYFKCESRQIVKLEASNGKQWSVKLQCDNRRDSYNLGRGWAVFMQENRVKVGDVCVFELTDARNHVLRVHVGIKSQLRNQHRWKCRKLVKLS